MVMGLSVIKAKSNESSLVKQVLPDIARDYTGLTGPCGLDEYGDRLCYRTGLYAIGYDPDIRWMLVGHYHSPSNEIIWER